MTDEEIEAKKEKLRDIIEGEDSNPVDVALASLTVTSARINLRDLERAVSLEQFSRIYAKLRDERNIALIVDMDEEGNYYLTEQQGKIIDKEYLDRGLLTEERACEFAKNSLEYDHEEFYHGNYFFRDPMLLQRAETRFSRIIGKHLDKIRQRDNGGEIE